MQKICLGLLTALMCGVFALASSQPASAGMVGSGLSALDAATAARSDIVKIHSLRCRVRRTWRGYRRACRGGGHHVRHHRRNHDGHHYDTDVDAPYASVHVGHGVRVRAPYVDLIIPGW